MDASGPSPRSPSRLLWRSPWDSLVAQLTELLHREGFLITAPEVAPLVSQAPSPPDKPAARVGRLVARLFAGRVTLPGIDAFVTRLYASVGRLLLARPAIALYTLVALCGLLTFLTSHRLQPVDLFAPRGIEMLFLVALFVVLLIFCHELAHALVCKSFGREVPGRLRPVFRHPHFLRRYD